MTHYNAAASLLHAAAHVCMLQPHSCPCLHSFNYAAASAAAACCCSAECATIGSTFSCSLGADWTKGDLVEIIMPVVATAGASGNVVNRAVVTDGNLTKLPESPVIILPDNTGVSAMKQSHIHLEPPAAECIA